jgi:hypothetical protein
VTPQTDSEDKEDSAEEVEKEEEEEEEGKEQGGSSRPTSKLGLRYLGRVVRLV